MSLDLARWIGLPYRDKGRGPDAFDCYGLSRAILAEQGCLLPDYADAYSTADDHASVSAAVRAGLAERWLPVDRPRAFDLIILNIAARPWHCGVMLSFDRFIHVMPPNPHTQVETYSCIERVDSPRWQRRIAGYYRHESQPGASP